MTHVIVLRNQHGIPLHQFILILAMEQGLVKENDYARK